MEKVDNENKKIISYDEQEVPFDCMVSIPVNMGDKMIERSGMGDDLNFVPTNKNTLQHDSFDNIFVIGDATNLPTSKAGSVAHFEADILHENLLAAIENRPFTGSFDGHANCYIETGYGKGTLIDFEIEGSKKKLTVFTTRPDTFFGITFLVYAPEHPDVSHHQPEI